MDLRKLIIFVHLLQVIASAFILVSIYKGADYLHLHSFGENEFHEFITFWEAFSVLLSQQIIISIIITLKVAEIEKGMPIEDHLINHL